MRALFRSRPLWKTRMRSTYCMVLKPCAMTSAVLPASRRFRASRINSSVFVSTLEVASSRIRKAGIVRQCTSEADQLPLADRQRGPTFIDFGIYSGWAEGRMDRPANFVQRMFDIGSCDARGSQADIRFNRAGEEERIL